MKLCLSHSYGLVAVLLENEHINETQNFSISLCRAVQHELELDIKDKTTAQNLDEAAKKINNGTRGIAFHNGIECHGRK